LFTGKPSTTRLEQLVQETKIRKFLFLFISETGMTRIQQLVKETKIRKILIFVHWHNQHDQKTKIGTRNKNYKISNFCLLAKSA